MPFTYILDDKGTKPDLEIQYGENANLPVKKTGPMKYIQEPKAYQ